jgi:hypothetical protein
VAVGALLIGNMFLHKPISNVCDALYARIGRTPYERLMLVVIATGSIVGALALVRGGWPRLRRRRALSCLLALAVVTVLVQRWMLVSNVELIHLPQFGLFAALLLAAGLGPVAAWVGATAAGVIDETYQYLVIYAHVPGVYFDYNDVVLNAIGAAWIVVLVAAAGVGDAVMDRGRWQRLLLAGLLVGLGVALWLAPPHIVAVDGFPYWRPALSRAATGLDYHVMPASEGLATLGLLWVLVRIATRASGEAAARPSAPVALMVALCLGGCAPSPRPATAPPALPAPGAWPGAARSDGVPRPEDQPFIVTFWCGPPLAEFSDQRAAEIAAAGFTVVGAPCEGAITPALNRRALDVAARHGLRMWISERRVAEAVDDAPNPQPQLAAAVADYRDHPALDGYFLFDEPTAAQFDDLAKQVAALRAADPGHLPYINLPPDFSPPDALGSASYGEYLAQFVATVQPPLLSFDYYPFKTDRDRATFFDNLGLVRATARAHDLPFLLIVQAMPHGPYRDPTAAEIAWQVNHALAFGARGISYFAYWTPVHVTGADRWRFRHGLVEGGQPTEHLGQVAQINRDARAWAHQLQGFTSIAVADSGGHFGTPLPIAPIAAIDGGSATAGFFVRDGMMAVLLVNQDYSNAQRVVLRLQPGAPLPQTFDPAAGRWQSLAERGILLPPGGARLLRWT